MKDILDNEVKMSKNEQKLQNRQTYFNKNNVLVDGLGIFVIWDKYFTCITHNINIFLIYKLFVIVSKYLKLCL